MTQGFITYWWDPNFVSIVKAGVRLWEKDLSDVIQEIFFFNLRPLCDSRTSNIQQAYHSTSSYYTKVPKTLKSHS